jgi:hypothetical protein
MKGSPLVRPSRRKQLITEKDKKAKQIYEKCNSGKDRSEIFSDTMQE